MAWSERHVSRPDLSCRKLFMSLNKMMLLLPMMKTLGVCACAAGVKCEQYYSDRSQGPQEEIPLTHTHA